MGLFSHRVVHLPSTVERVLMLLFFCSTGVLFTLVLVMVVVYGIGRSVGASEAKQFWHREATRRENLARAEARTELAKAIVAEVTDKFLSERD